jgi:hypothetical protein
MTSGRVEPSMADEPVPQSPGEEARHRRGLKFRARDDHAVELFREAQANLGDVARVDRILFELGRFYNPSVNGPIVDLAARKRIVDLLNEGDAPGARRLLDERLALYVRIAEDEGE